MPDYTPLQKCRTTEEAEELTTILKRNHLNFKISSSARAFDVSQLGSLSNDPNDKQLLISVLDSDFEAARSILEENEQSIPLPPDHFLNNASDDDLIEILGNPESWSPFDVAHAKKMSHSRGIDSEKIQAKTNERIAAIEKGKAASKKLIYGGWITSILGALTGPIGLISLIGIGIALSLCCMKEKTPNGRFYTFDPQSRKGGKRMLTAYASILVIAWFLRLMNTA